MANMHGRNFDQLLKSFNLIYICLGRFLYLCGAIQIALLPASSLYEVAARRRPRRTEWSAEKGRGWEAGAHEYEETRRNVEAARRSRA